MGGQLHTHWIEVDAYDRRAFASLVDEAPSLRSLIDSGNKLLPHFDGFLLDLYALLYKLNVVRHDETRVVPSAGFYRLLLDRILGTPMLEALRRRTELDEYEAGIATLLLGERLLALLRSEQVLNRGAMLDFWGLERQEADIDARDEEITTARQLADEVDGRSERRLRDAARRIERENEAARRHLERARVRVSQAAADGVERNEDAIGEMLHRSFADGESESASAAETTEDSETIARQLGLPTKRSVGAQVELGKRLASSRKLRRLARLVGRMRAEARGLKRSVFQRAATELHETAMGGEISRLLPNELLALRHPRLRDDFLRRLVERQLSSYQLRDQEKGARGPMVVCIDGSSSMEGDKEIWAKAVSLTLLDIARRQRRAFRSICFAGRDHPLQTIDLHRPSRIAPSSESILELAEYFPGGGTDFQRPLQAAVEALQEKPYRSGDIVFITDGECQIDPEWRERFLAEKEALGFSLLAVLIDVGSSSLSTLEAISDKVTPVSELSSAAGASVLSSV